MRNRILVGLGFVSTVVCFFLLSIFVHQRFLDFLICLLIYVAVIEVKRSFKEKLSKSYDQILHIYGLTLALPYFFLGFAGVVYYTLAIFMFGVLFGVFSKNSLQCIVNFTFVLIYPGLVMSAMLYINNSLLAAIGFCLFFAVSTLTDVFAMFGGLLWGRHKLAPDISPKKTVEGAICGVLGGIIGTVAVFVAFEVFDVFGPYALSFTEWGLSQPNMIIVYVVLGIFGSVLTQLGDLFASFVKRGNDVKDFSQLLGNHGGVMDRFDGIVFNACFVAMVFTFILEQVKNI